ncbi:MAG: GNAT family N-acetyltransferase [Bacteroidetes bacterium]|nr:MAG: GNAT family N-acetyltransferase [Bacteroidota bacterium]
MIEIVDYKPEYQPHWERLNREWIKVFFEIEPFDEYVLQNPEKAIINDGGAILIALYNGEVAGTAGLRKIDDEVFEFTKMTVGEEYRRKGIAEAMCYASFEKAKQLGAKTVILYSNTLQAAAIKMYEKIGFQHLPVENTVYKRANVKMKMDLSEVSKKESLNI